MTTEGATPEPPAAPPTVPTTNAPPLRAQVPLDSDGRVADDVPCRGCGYNLLGLAADGQCPECSSEIDRSLRGDLLRFTNPTWLERLARGTRWLIGGLIAGVAVMVCTIAATVAFGGAGNLSMVTGVAGLLVAGCAGACTYGMWLITTPEAGAAEQERRLSARRLARWCFFAEVFAWPMQMGSGPFGIGAMAGIAAQPTALMQLLGIGSVAITLVVAVGELAGLVYLRSLARRMPRPAVATQTTIVLWGYGAAQVLGIVFGVLMLLALPTLAGITGGPAPTASATLIGLSIGGCGVVLLGIAFGVWALVVLFVFASAFTSTAEAARRLWAGPAPGPSARATGDSLG